MQQDLVSVIVPVYKVPERMLRRCVESVMSQTLRGIEIILVDDGSPDRCGEICDGYAAQDSRVKVVHKENGGLAAARNTGFRAATGKWFTFVDGDDWIEPDMLECLYGEGERSGAQVVASGYLKDFGDRTSAFKVHLEDGKLYVGDECRRLRRQVLEIDGNVCEAWGKLIDRELCVREDITHDTDIRQGAESILFNMKLFGKAERVMFVNRPFYHYMYNEDSISAVYSEANLECCLRCFERIREDIETDPDKDVLLPLLDIRLLYTINTAAVSLFFNPAVGWTYRERKRKCTEFLQRPIIRHALESDEIAGLPFLRRAMLVLVRRRIYPIVSIAGRFWQWQKNHRSALPH